MSKTIIAIDPGAVGGIAMLQADIVTANAMPKTLADIRDMLECGMLIDPDTTAVYMEDVGTYMPGNSGPSAATFAEHVGALKGILTCLRVRFEMIRPTKWMHAYIGKPQYAEKKKDYDPKAWRTILARRKQERKNAIKARSQREFPNLKVTLKTSDALGILWYGAKEEAGRLF
ncbi:MAG: RuvC family protein [Planctomycetota bacterium]|jgi:hypothetical protein